MGVAPVLETQPHSASAVEPCRVTVVGTRRRMEVALPADMPVAYLLPPLLQRLEANSVHDGHHGHAAWVLQRFGEPELDVELTLSGQGVHHGDVLYLRPRAQALPALAVDDVVEAVAAATAELPLRWNARAARAGYVTAAAAAGLCGAGLLVTVSAQWTVAAACAALLLAGAVAISRGAGDRAGAVLAGLAIPYASLSAAMFVAGNGPLRPVAAQVLAAGAAGCVAAVIGAVATGTHRQWFMSLAVLGGCGAIGAGVALNNGAMKGAAVVVCVALIAGHLLPGLAARLAGLPRPIVPSRPSEVREQPPTPDAASVRRGTAMADSYLAALTAAFSVAAGAGGAALAADPGWAGPTLAAVTSTALALRARHLGGAVARGWLLAPAGILALALAAGLASRTHLALGFTALALVAVAAAHALPGRRISPWWGRIGDWIEVLAVLAAVPVALQVLGVYAAVRALGG